MKNVVSMPFLCGIGLLLVVLVAMFASQSRGADFVTDYDQAAVACGLTTVLECGCPGGGSCTITRERSMQKSITIAPLNDTTPACAPACEKATEHKAARKIGKALRVPMKILITSAKATGKLRIFRRDE